MVNIEIDGVQLHARDGAMVIEAADEAGIPIPRFCYHSKLSVAANCRMCLVEVEKARKPLPACATPVTEGMKVFTKSRQALDAQKGTMEFLLINHPLDCPICDQGGECDLQEMAMGYGGSHSRFGENKRVVKDKNIGPLIATDMTRCIHCTRCVRFGDEIAGLKELGATGRGEHMEIGTYVERSVVSEMSGNVIDLCPVGALTSKPFRYQARAWEMQSRPTIAPHDCMGSNLEAHVRGPKVMRMVPQQNEQINETWISDRDRFSYEGLNSYDRLQRPMIKKDGQWQEVSWEIALEYTINGLKDLVARHGAGQFGALASPSSTVEEMYLLQKLVRGMGSANIDHRVRQLDFTDQDTAPLFPWLGQSIENLEQLDAALLVGSNVRKDQPIAAHRLRKAALRGAKVMCVNPVDYDFNFPVSDKLVAGVGGMEHALAGMAKALLKATRAKAPEGLDKLLAEVQTNETHETMARQLSEGENTTILLGIGALLHPHMATLRALANVIGEISGAKVGYLSDGANTAGGWLVGALPHRSAGGKGTSFGLHTQGMFESRLKGYMLMGLEPEFDCADPATAMAALQEAEFVVALSSYQNESMAAYANVILPMAPFTETSGTFVNAEGRWQAFSGVVQPLGETRPAWKILRVMGNMLGIDGFNHVSSQEVLEEIDRAVGEIVPDNTMAWRCPEKLNGMPEGITRIAEVPIYGVDPIVRRAAGLQKTQDAQMWRSIKIGQPLASRLGLEGATEVVVRQGEQEVTLPLAVDDDVPDGHAVLASALPGVAPLRTGGTPVELKQA